MRGIGIRWAALTACVAALGLGTGAAPAWGAAEDPLFVYTPMPPSTTPPPGGYLDGPCGLAVTSSGSSFYLSDYYHHAVDLFSSNSPPSYSSQPLVNTAFAVDHTGPVDDPCGLALDPAGTLYVNNFHRNVVRFPTPISLATGTVIAGAPLDFSRPTGVAVDPATGDVYVDERTYVAVFDSSGAPLEEGGEPVKIGLDSNASYYGLALSAYPGTSGYLYVPDAATNTVKVYDPATSKTTPVQTIAPGTSFTSLRDAAVAVDRVSGNVYVVDDLQPAYTEQPQAQVDVFSAGGTYLGVLKYKIVDALPPGLAVDNSAGGTQGRVYVTSGNTVEASVYGYPPGAQTSFAQPAMSEATSVGAAFEAPSSSSSSSSPAPLAARARNGGGASASEVTQNGNLRILVKGRMSPSSLPRKGAAPIAVSVGGQVSTTDESRPPQLERLRIEINRNGHLDYRGLPLCRVGQIQPASSARALAACRAALVGRGSFSGTVSLPGQLPYPIEGGLLVFNGRAHGRQVLFAHIYSSHPFTTSFLIVFQIAARRHGTYGTTLTANLAKSLGTKRNLTGMEMTLRRRYSYRGARHSFLSAGCPAPAGFRGAIFPLARTTFTFAGGKTLTSTLTRSCKVRG